MNMPMKRFNFTLLTAALIMVLQSANILAKTNVSMAINDYMEAMNKAEFFNGNALVVHKGRIVYDGQLGFTSGDKQNKLQKDNLFALGSITKEFNAVAIMMLKEKGLLSLNDKVSTFGLALPAWSEKIQVKHLLNYTSGLPRFNFRAVKAHTDDLEQLRTISKLQFEPGSDYLYSNHNTFLQMRIVERVSGLPFAEFVEKHILKPLKMTQALFNANPNKSNAVFSFGNDGKNDAVFDFPIKGLMYLTTEDAYTWVNSLFTGKVINHNSIAHLFSAFSDNAEASLGHGQYVDGKLVSYYHHGSNFNFEALYFYDLQEDLIIILMTNNKDKKLFEISKSIGAIIANR